MDSSTVKGKCKKNLIFKAWERCRSLGAGCMKKIFPTDLDTSTLTKSKPCHRTKTSSDRQKKSQVAPEGCFSVYVGPQKQRFVVKAKFANHPLFAMLLEDAEAEYGYSSEGPILLPCDVDLFYRVLAEMDGSDEMISTPGCSFGKAYGSLIFPRRSTPAHI
ncbi:auxin-responsive protein SAUR72-like [Corylus avellana]|uniref:auxin-responsive protein SAUR72-like n=1 Tax=Corylus avellana TaxID=13451 RepID=UPI001E224BAD|nr:auxin-responsive protein SAUR72-like [Corylus avellana]